MGYKKNKPGSHACRSKYHRKFVQRKVAVCHQSLNNGSRIINLDNLHHLQVVTNHVANCQPCINQALSKEQAIVIAGECKAGLASILTIRCTGCNKEFSFPTSSKVRGSSGGSFWECNLAAVWGQTMTGGGHATLTEALAVIGVLVMTRQSFVAAEKRIGEWWWILFEDTMKSAGEEERTLAISQNRYHQGVPAITVILDSGWCKRTHKHSYNVKSGVGVIIGKETGKILFLGVRNKFCSLCSCANNLNQHPAKHTCFRNWNTSSSAMETDIILEGFLKYETQHGLHYISFIGDGDSSVYPTLILSVPWGYVITKIECANHCIKCYRTALEKLVHDNPSYKEKGKLTESKCKQLTKAARSAIIMCSKENNRPEAIKKLQKDLINVPLHCFGYHEKCSTDFCKTAKKLNTSDLTHTNLPATSHSNSNTEETVTSAISDNNHCDIPEVAAADEDNTEVTVDHNDNIIEIISDLQEAWHDATDDSNLEEVRDIPAAPPHTPLDNSMICDIQRIASRLVAKAPQLMVR